MIHTAMSQEMKEAKKPSEEAYKRYIEAEVSKKTLNDIKKTLDSHLINKKSSTNIVPNLKKQESNKANTR